MAKRQGYEYEGADDDIRYYDMLYDFAGVVTKVNEQSFEGLEPKRIASILRRSAEAFCRLCMADTITGEKGQDIAQKTAQVHKEETPPIGRETVTEQQKEEKPIPDNFLRVDRNGWGLCPVCHSKVLKVTSATRLENFPVFCKRCRADHLVNWWNVDNQRILYNKHISERHIREQAYKGTGLRSFRNTGSSAPERVVMDT